MNCDQSSRLLSDRQERPLPVVKKMKLWIHLASCKICKGYSKYLGKLRVVSREIGGLENLPEMDTKLSSNARAEILKKLQK